MGGPASVFEARPSDPGTARMVPGWFESVGLAEEQAAAAPDFGNNEANYNGRIRADIENALRERGYSLHRTGPAPAPQRRKRSGDDGFERPLLAADEPLWAALAAERKINKDFMKQYGDVHDWGSLTARSRRQRAEDLQRLNAQLDDAPLSARLVGGLIHGVKDPSSYIPVGGPAKAGLSVLRQILEVGAKEAVANVALTTALEPVVSRDARRIGIERTWGDAASDIGLAGATGLVIGGGVQGASIAAGKLLGEREIVDSFRRAVPEENRTPAEKAAVAVLEREADVADTSPLLGGEVNATTHERLLGDAYARAVRGAAPSPPKRVTRGELLAGTADPAQFRFPAREQLKARIRQAESGGDDQARNPLSTASGRYQFTMGTWLALYRQRYGKAGKSNDIWAKRFDPHLQDVLMEDLTALNARSLRGAGRPETAGNLYLLHFAGEQGGLKVLAADPSAPASTVLGSKVVASNPFLKDMTAGDLIAWADRKMGGSAAPPTRAAEGADPLPELPAIDRRPILVEDMELRPDWADQVDVPLLRAELFATPEEHAAAQVALWREHDTADGFAQVVDDPPPAGPAVEVATVRPRSRSGPEHVMLTIAEAGGLLDNEGHDLVKGRGIPKFALGAGAIVRPDGTAAARGVDAIGEVLWGRGYFGPPSTTPRPRESEIIDLIERAARGKVYAPDVRPEEIERSRAWLARAEEEDARLELQDAARRIGAELDGATLEDALARRALGEDVDESIGGAIEAAAWRDAPASAGLERFDDPDGDGAQAQIASLEHDLRMMLEEGDDGLYRLGEEGDEMTLAEIFEELDGDAGAVETLRGCMT